MRLLNWYILLIVGSSQLMIGCVGPMTPFGSVDAYSLKSNEPLKLNSQLMSEREYPRISVWPKKQFLHDRHPLTIEVHDKVQRPDVDKVKVVYNDIDVTGEFVDNSEIEFFPDKKMLTLTYKGLRLQPTKLNEIQFYYEAGKEKLAQLNYPLPVCEIFSKKNIANTSGFRPPKRYLAMIGETARKKDYNPNLIAGIVAQESGFNPRAISWAKAIGLMQVTPIAEAEIIKNFKDWPRYPAINKMSYVTLKSKIISGEITGDKEWRLKPEYSVKGGTSYIDYLKGYWAKKRNRQVVESLPGDFDENLSRVILASYNSGAARVKKNIRTDKDKWLENESLSEAMKYVNKVSSYCYHFAQVGDGDG